MRQMLAAAWVIARRDFVGTVWSRSFLLFLLAPIMAFGFAALIVRLTTAADIEASRPVIAVAMAEEDQRAVLQAHQRFTGALGELRLPVLKFEEPAPNPDAQARLLLSSSASNVSAVLTGSLASPTLTAPERSVKALGGEAALLLEYARSSEAPIAGRSPAAALRTVATRESGGSLNMVRHALARGGQFVVFFITLMLATLLLTNLVEEKANKVIEVLAAAVPLDAVFLGKLLAMLGVSFIGLAIWGSVAGAVLYLSKNLIDLPVDPAVGWPAFVVLVVVYFVASYMLLGAVFLGVGGQASNVREIQTLSMPITLAQVMIFVLASVVVGDDGGTMTWVAAIFPLSSPLSMIALAAQNGALLPHLLAILWQALWVALIIRFSARLFRATVLKSATRESFFAIFRARKA